MSVLQSADVQGLRLPSAIARIQNSSHKSTFRKNSKHQGISRTYHAIVDIFFSKTKLECENCDSRLVRSNRRVTIASPWSFPPGNYSFTNRLDSQGLQSDFLTPNIFRTKVSYFCLIRHALWCYHKAVMKHTISGSSASMREIFVFFQDLSNGLLKIEPD